MEPERHEVYERIPWESLERPQADRPWLLIAIAGAVALGALGYSFMKNQAVSPAQPVASPAPVTMPVGTLPPAPVSLPSPVVVAEADLFAVDPERLIDQAAAHAEWFAVEYFSVDGSDSSATTVAALLPAGVPQPEAPEGTQVFVDWVGAQSIVESAPLTFTVEVAVRSLMSGPDGMFARQPTRLASVEVLIGPDGLARVTSPPTVREMTVPVSHPMGLVSVPASVADRFSGWGEVVGGVQLPDGTWKVVIMSVGPDGVIRPITAISS